MKPTEMKSAAMREFVSRKTAGLFRKLSPQLKSDHALAHYARAKITPIPPTQPDTVRNMPLTVLGSRGIDLHLEEQLARVASWRSEENQKLFEEIRQDPALRINVSGFYSTPDAEIYAMMILDRKPRRLIEVGSGYSTLLARKVIQYGGSPTELIAIDPWPRTDVQAAVDRLYQMPVEQSHLIDFDWSPEDLLFIDSSHLCRTRGDLPYLYCQLLPSLPAGVLVHVHDIYLPYDYPNLYDKWCYNELYLLACLLAHSPRYHTVLATHWLSREHRQVMLDTFGPMVSKDGDLNYNGCSFWFEIRA